jgi:hypothetical protein
MKKSYNIPLILDLFFFIVLIKMTWLNRFCILQIYDLESPGDLHEWDSTSYYSYLTQRHIGLDDLAFVTQNWRLET